jgi:hypothetical protein
MLRRIDEREVHDVDLAPQAVIRMSVADFRKQSGASFEFGSDDLDSYEAAFYILDNTTFALIHHAGEPEDTISLYLDRRMTPETRQKIVRRITKELGIPDDLVRWQEESRLALR